MTSLTKYNDLIVIKTTSRSTHQGHSPELFVISVCFDQNSSVCIFFVSWTTLLSSQLYISSKSNYLSHYTKEQSLLFVFNNLFTCVTNQQVLFLGVCDIICIFISIIWCWPAGILTTGSDSGDVESLQVGNNLTRESAEGDVWQIAAGTYIIVSRSRTLCLAANLSH